MKKIISKLNFQEYKRIKTSNPSIINNIKELEKLGFNKEQQRLLKNNYDRLNYLYNKVYKKLN